MTNENEKQRKQTFAEIIEQYGMNAEQVEFYQNYSKERSCFAYEKIAKRELGTTELIADWKYAGYYDAGYRGADHCSAGHALRYVHIAKNEKTGKEIKFGIKCVSDFFKLTPTQLKFIKAGFNEANREIMSSIDTYVKYNGDYAKYTEYSKIDEKFHYIMETDSTVLIRVRCDRFEELLKLAEMSRLCDLRLPFPSEFEWRINGAYRSLKYMEKRKALKAEAEEKALQAEVAEKELNDVVTETETETETSTETSLVAISPAKQKIVDMAERMITNDYIKDHHKKVVARLEELKSEIITGTSKIDDDGLKMRIEKLVNTHYEDIDKAIKKIDDANKMSPFVKSVAYQLERYGLTEKQENAIKRIADKL